MDTDDFVTVFYYGAFLPVANGGNARLADLLDRLQDEFSHLILYGYADHPDFPWHEGAEALFRARWPRIELVLERYGWPLRQVTHVKNLLISLVSPEAAAHIVAFAVPGPTPRFAAVKRRSGAFVVSYVEGLTQVNGLDPARCLVETHDVNFVKWSKMNGRRSVSLTALRKFRGEMTALATVRSVVAIAAGEAAFFRMMIARPVYAVPTWNSGLAASALPERDTADFDLVFVGSAYVMNVRGFCAFVEAHHAWLARYRVAVCGLVCEQAAVRAAVADHANIQLLGFVEDMDDIYRRSRAAVSPVEGTGTKMKVLAALAAGLPVFASAQSREGLPPGFEGAVFEISEAAVAHVLNAAPCYEAAAACARRYDATLRASGEAGAVIAEIRHLVPSNAKPAPPSWET